MHGDSVCELKRLIHMYILRLYFIKDIYVSRTAFSISAVKTAFSDKKKKKKHFRDLNFKCVFGVSPCWHGSDLLLVIRSHWSIGEHGVHSHYIQSISFWLIFWNRSSRLLTMANFLTCLTYAYLCSRNKPVTSHLPITICPFSIMTPEIMIKITIISSPLLHTSRDCEEGAV